MADFITKLPLAQGYNSVLVVVDHFTKMTHFVSTTEKTTAEELARLFRDNMWRLHGLCQNANSESELSLYSLSALDKENSLESSLHWSVYLYIIYLVCALVIPCSQPDYV